jgi:hypothetical protein
MWLVDLEGKKTVVMEVHLIKLVGASLLHPTAQEVHDF